MSDMKFLCHELVIKKSSLCLRSPRSMARLLFTVADGEPHRPAQSPLHPTDPSSPIAKKRDVSGMNQNLEPGRNCWRIERADRVACLVDGADYFRALRASLKQAEESILILAWDIDSRLQLVREDPADGLLVEFGAFLNALISRKRRLHGHILSWDFAMLFALDREWLPIFKLDWKTHRRLRFHMDDRHPFGGSHHQKVVVIVDRLAFAGGLELSLGRWDTSEHRRDDPRRIELGHVRARPYHDVQMAVSGDAARALGALARHRSRCAPG